MRGGEGVPLRDLPASPMTPPLGRSAGGAAGTRVSASPSAADMALAAALRREGEARARSHEAEARMRALEEVVASKDREIQQCRMVIKVTDCGRRAWGWFSAQRAALTGGDMLCGGGSQRPSFHLLVPPLQLREERIQRMDIKMHNSYAKRTPGGEVLTPSAPREVRFSTPKARGFTARLHRSHRSAQPEPTRCLKQRDPTTNSRHRRVGRRVPHQREERPGEQGGRAPESAAGRGQGGGHEASRAAASLRGEPATLPGGPQPLAPAPGVCIKPTA